MARTLLAYAFGQPPQDLRVSGAIKTDGTVLVVGGDEASYIAALRRARGEPEVPAEVN